MSMGNSQIYALFFALFSGFLTLSTRGCHFYVGGKDGWGLNPSQNYSSWAEHLRFHINDTLVFRYDDGSDSVLVVNKQDYDQCYSDSPAAKLAGGNSAFILNRSGPFFFISGNASRCDHGEKVVVVVLAERRTKTPTPPPAAPPKSSPDSPAPGSGYSPSPNSSAPATPPPQSSFAAAAWSHSVGLVLTASVVACVGGFGFY